MDIIKKLKPFKASYIRLPLTYRCFIFVMLLSLISISIPHQTMAIEKKPLGPALVFVKGDYRELFSSMEWQAKENFKKEQLKKQALKQLQLQTKITAYLNSYHSPLAFYTSTLLQQKNWKKIVALAAAESSMCRKFPLSKANCWGIGGSNLWDMGDNLGEGVIAMNKFLENHPTKSKVKYSKMSFDDMNGLYKQPAADHWVNNNLSVYNDLVSIEKGL